MIAILRRALLAMAFAVAVMPFVLAAPAPARVDAGGSEIPNTATGPVGATPGWERHRVSGPSQHRLLADPAPDRAPGHSEDPQTLASLDSTAGPEEDLLTALRDLQNAADVPAASAARARALAILEGEPIAGRAYSGLPLLNHGMLRRQTVPAPTAENPVPEVTVREVRFGDHSLVDTPLLDFADPDAAFRVRYRMAELGGGLGGYLAPVALLADGATPLGGQHSVLQSLTPPLLATGTTDSSRFHPSGDAELTRLRVQDVVVAMPPPKYVTGIVSPNMRAGHETLSTVRKATADRIAALEAIYGATPTREDGIAKIGDLAPEKSLWRDLKDNDPSVVGLDLAKAVGANDAQLVAAMSDRDTIPGALGDPDAAADLEAVVVNNEIYVSRRRMSLPGSGPLTVAITNRDAFTREVEVGEMAGRRQVFGAIDWGEFDFRRLGEPRTVAPNATARFTVTPAADAFGLIVGDAVVGTEGTAHVELERGPLKETLDFGGSTDAPLHVAEGRDGEQWVTLEGVDKIARLSPGERLSSTTVERFTLPRPARLDPIMPLAPHDIAVDPNGIVWATLTLGNAIARIDPAQVQDGTSNGITLYDLPLCHECPPPFPPPPVPEPETREPIQMEVSLDGEGNTLVWFNEAASNEIGLLRVAPGGRELQQTHYPCNCGTPLGIAAAPNGDIWFSETVENRIGRLRLDQARPYAVSTVQLDHFDIPSGVQVQDPALGPTPIFTAEVHSLAVDAQNRVWFSESATGKLGRLDPELARPGTRQGMEEFDLPGNDFGRPAVPADLTIDRAGNVFWVDEYGDVVGERAADGRHRTWRPAARNSLTDAPMVDQAGDLYFLEVGANVLTRLRDVSPGGVLRPGTPPRITTDLRDGSVSGTALRATTEVDVAVLRGGTHVGSAADVPVADGRFSISAWTGSPPRPDDLVRISRTGPHQLARIELRVPALTAAQTGGGVEGAARRLGAPLFGVVALEGAGPTARIDALDGGWRIATSPPAGALVSWTEGTPAAQLRTLAAIAGVPAPTTGGGAAGTNTGASGGPGGAADTTSAPPRDAIAVSPAERPGARRAPVCRTTWLRRRGRSITVPQLGLTAARARACLGAPAWVRRLPGGRERWSLGVGVKLRLTRGKVTGILLTRRNLTSTPDRAAVGASLTALRRALGAGRLDRRARRYLVSGRSGRTRIAVVASLDRRLRRVTALDVREEGTR